MATSDEGDTNAASQHHPGPTPHPKGPSADTQARSNRNVQPMSYRRQADARHAKKASLDQPLTGSI